MTLTPILLFNIAFVRLLPSAYRSWERVPYEIRIAENIVRGGVMVLPILMDLHIVTHRQQIGLYLYLLGLVIYFASWAVQIRYPDSSWCRSAFGFMAPAYTPIIWMSGIGLIGSVRLASMSWVYWTLVALFLSLHNIHAGLAYARNSRHTL